MESRLRASPEQFAALLEFMERHGDITRPKQGLQARVKSEQQWQELGEFLNSIAGGISKPLEKWKKVWADWKAKTKKKALVIRREASGAGGGPSSRQTLTVSEERVLGVMGLTAIIRQVGIKKREFDAPPSEENSLPPPTKDTVAIVHTVCPSQSPATDVIMLDIIPVDSVQASTSTAIPSLSPRSGELSSHPASLVPTPPPGAAPSPIPSASSPTPSIPQGVPHRSSPLPSIPRKVPHRSSPSPSIPRWIPHRSSLSPTTSRLRRRRRFRGHSRRTQTHLEQATSEFLAIEHRWLQLHADREKYYHEREMEKLRLESRRIEMREKQNQILSRLTNTLDNLMGFLPQLRASSSRSTDVP